MLEVLEKRATRRCPKDPKRQKSGSAETLSRFRDSLQEEAVFPFRCSVRFLLQILAGHLCGAAQRPESMRAMALLVSSHHCSQRRVRRSTHTSKRLQRPLHGLVSWRQLLLQESTTPRLSLSRELCTFHLQPFGWLALAAFGGWNVEADINFSFAFASSIAGCLDECFIDFPQSIRWEGSTLVPVGRHQCTTEISDYDFIVYTWLI